MFRPSMHRLIVGVLAVPALGITMPAAATGAAPTGAAAASRTTVAGTAVIDTTNQCPAPPDGYGDYSRLPTDRHVR